MTTRRITKTFALTDERRESLISMPLENMINTMIEYRDIMGRKFEYSAAELIAAGYLTVPGYIVIEAVYVLQPNRSKNAF